MNVLILGINFSPERTGIGPYTTQIAQHLALGHNVTVIAGTPHYPDWRADNDWPRRVRVRRWYGEVDVIHLPHFIPKRQDALRRLAYETSWAAQAAILGSRFRATDVVISIVPPLFGAAASHYVAQRLGVPLGVVVQDIMSTAAGQSGIIGGSAVAGLASRLEGWALRAADGIVTIHPHLADLLQANFRLIERPRVIHNWAHIRPAGSIATRALRDRMGWGDSVVALHSGNMGLKQDLATVVAAAQLARDQRSDVRFVLAGGGSQFEALKHLSKSAVNIDVLPSVSDEDFPALLAAADVLLVNERPGMTGMSVPSKLTSYFTAGKPVVAATDSDSATASFLRATDAAVLISAGNPAGILEAVQRLAADPSRAQALGASGRRFANEKLSSTHALAEYDNWVAGLGHVTQSR